MLYLHSGVGVSEGVGVFVGVSEGVNVSEGVSVNEGISVNEGVSVGNSVFVGVGSAKITLAHSPMIGENRTPIKPIKATTIRTLPPIGIECQPVLPVVLPVVLSWIGSREDSSSSLSISSSSASITSMR
jgi:hypothetical protein